MSKAAARSAEHLVWITAGPSVFEHTEPAAGITVRVEHQANDTWRATSAAANAPAGHILAYRQCSTRREAMDWCRDQIPGATATMHLIEEAS